MSNGDSALPIGNFSTGDGVYQYKTRQLEGRPPSGPSGNGRVARGSLGRAASRGFIFGPESVLGPETLKKYKNHGQNTGGEHASHPAPRRRCSFPDGPGPDLAAVYRGRKRPINH